MKNFSKDWYDALATERFTDAWPDEFGPRIPVLPFVTIPLPPEMREAFRAHGELHYFQPEESIIEGAVVKGLQLVESGLSARITATLEGQAGPGLMALAAPHRFATGNLNFATRRPQIGQYRAVSKVTTRRIAHIDAERLDWLTDPVRMRMLLSVKESINLSDRMALTISALLPAPMRFASLLIAMAVFFGTIGRTARSHSHSGAGASHCDRRERFRRDARKTRRRHAAERRARARRGLLDFPERRATAHARMDARDGRQ